MPRARSQRASQKPSRPASNATTTRLISRPALTACCCHRCNSASNPFSSAPNFFNGWRSIPGTIPATSQELRLNSTTASKVLAWSNAVEDFLLWSFLYDMAGQLPRASAAEGCHAFTACPITSQNLVRDSRLIEGPRGRVGALRIIGF